MYSEMKKNIENSDAPVSSPTTLAPVSVRMRKIENGTSGAAERQLDRDEAPSSATEPRQQPDRLGRAPARVGRLDQRVDEQRQARR